MDMGETKPGGTDESLTIRLNHCRSVVPVIHVGGRLDHRTAPGLQHLLNEQFTAAPWGIVLDLSALSVLEPRATPTLVHIANRAGEANIGLCLVIPDSAVRRVLTTVGISELFEICPTIEAALRTLS
jgi:anti-anti-sigma factor